MGDEIGREWGGEGALARVRQADREPPGVEELTRQTARVAAPSIHRVANDREMRVREMNAYLVRAAGDRLDVQQGGPVVSAAPRRDGATC